MNATEVKNLIGKKVVITTTTGTVEETTLREVRTHKATNTVAGIVFESQITSTFQGKTTTMQLPKRMPASRISSIKAVA